MAFLNPADHDYFSSKSTSSKTVFVEIKGFILRADKLKDIPQGEVGLSKFMRESIEIAKSERFEVTPAKIRDKNPLNSVELTVDLLFRHDSLEVDA